MVLAIQRRADEKWALPGSLKKDPTSVIDKLFDHECISDSDKDLLRDMLLKARPVFLDVGRVYLG